MCCVVLWLVLVWIVVGVGVGVGVCFAVCLLLLVVVCRLLLWFVGCLWLWFVWCLLLFVAVVVVRVGGVVERFGPLCPGPLHRTAQNFALLFSLSRSTLNPRRGDPTLILGLASTLHFWQCWSCCGCVCGCCGYCWFGLPWTTCAKPPNAGPSLRRAAKGAPKGWGPEV